MEALILELAKGLGISHVNAALIGIFMYVVIKGFRNLSTANESVTKAVEGMTTEVKLTNQWCQLHDKEDNRRFGELHTRLGERRSSE